MGVSNTFIGQLLAGKTPITSRVAEHFGFTRETVFSKTVENRYEPFRTYAGVVNPVAQHQRSKLRAVHRRVLLRATSKWKTSRSNPSTG